MSVRPIDVMMMQQINEVTQIKQNENAKPVAQQVNISAEVQKDVENRAEQVTQKSDVDNREKKFDAKEKSENEYHKQSGGKKKESDGRVTIKSKDNYAFDMKV